MIEETAEQKYKRLREDDKRASGNNPAVSVLIFIRSEREEDEANGSSAEDGSA